MVDSFKSYFYGSAMNESNITVILTGWKRPYNLAKQVSAIRNQTYAPHEIWLWINRAVGVLNDFDEHVDKVFDCNYNWGVFGRFAAATLVRTPYVCFFDDDTVPGENYLAECMKYRNIGILGSAGVTLTSRRYDPHIRSGWPSKNTSVERVDLVGHSIFCSKDYLRYFYWCNPPSWKNAEDIHLAWTAQVYGGVNCFVTPHPENDKSIWGSIQPELGLDNVGMSMPWNHSKFFSERDNAIDFGLKQGWKTIKEI